MFRFLAIRLKKKPLELVSLPGFSRFGLLLNRKLRSEVIGVSSFGKIIGDTFLTPV